MNGRPDDVEGDWWTHPGAPAPLPPRQAKGAPGPYRGAGPTQPPTGGVMAPPRRPTPNQSPTGQPAPGPVGPHQQPNPQPHAHRAPQHRGAPGAGDNRQTPWATEPESSFTTWARRFLRGLVVVVLLLAAISGVRSWIRPNTTAPPATTAESTYPKDEARAVGTRFAMSYLSWDELNPDTRPAAIKRDLATGLDERVGWNGRGRQAAAAAYPGEVTVDPGGVVAQVDVRVMVVPFTRNGRAFVRGKPTWQRISIPVARTASRVVVSGPPTYVADEPAALPDNLPDAGVPDDDLTAVTLNDAKAFFGAYGESDAKVAAVTAPGASIRSLNGTVKLKELTDWQVFTGDDNERHATAAVTWSGSGDTTLDQTYSLTLRRTVAADGAQRWQVAAVG
ncbi:hypothetical protein [Kribbella deserti]|uniref:Conjugative transposon protein TcpC n=1 Tax=Kribbella deserti TaxID=1926257 RepID=A0ABV6QFB0_9ACTN